MSTPEMVALRKDVEDLKEVVHRLRVKVEIMEQRHDNHVHEYTVNSFPPHYTHIPRRYGELRL